MICPNCGVSIQVDRPNCPNCGTMIGNPQYYQDPRAQAASTYQVQNVLIVEEKTKRTNMIIGMILVFVGLGLIPLIVFTIDLFIGYFVCAGVFICLCAGAIVLLTNLTKKYKNSEKRWK